MPTRLKSGVGEGFSTMSDPTVLPPTSDVDEAPAPPDTTPPNRRRRAFLALALVLVGYGIWAEAPLVVALVAALVAALVLAAAYRRRAASSTDDEGLPPSRSRWGAAIALAALLAAMAGWMAVAPVHSAATSVAGWFGGDTDEAPVAKAPVAKAPAAAATGYCMIGRLAATDLGVPPEALAVMPAAATAPTAAVRFVAGNPVQVSILGVKNAKVEKDTGSVVTLSGPLAGCPEREIKVAVTVPPPPGDDGDGWVAATAVVQ